MKNLKTGQFFGDTTEVIHLNGITLTDTVYTHAKVGWHYHENAYFTFILEGKILEGNKKETYHCTSGDLLFHNWQDAHYNIKPAGYTRGFHIEFDPLWFDALQINTAAIQGSMKLLHPQLKMSMYQVFKEVKLEEANCGLTVAMLLTGLFSDMERTQERFSKKIPLWVYKIREVLNDAPTENWTLFNLAAYLDIHPVHLSRGFSKYFNCTLGEYLRKIKLGKALSMLTDRTCSLTTIALRSGFSDQSHFIRSFKDVLYIKPAEYRKLLLK